MDGGVVYCNHKEQRNRPKAGKDYIMTLYNIINSIPCGDTATIVNYITGDIIIDCEAVTNIIDSKTFRDISKYKVYKLEVGKIFSDLIISVVEE